jgi:hypothetical protein
MTRPTVPEGQRRTSHATLESIIPSMVAEVLARRMESQGWRAGEAEGGVRLALERFLNTSYPNNGEGRTDRLVWMVPESAFGPLRVALASPEPDEEAR